MVARDSDWFTEFDERGGTGFALRLGAGRHLHGDRSDFQTIDIYDTDAFGRLMVIDGCTMVSTRDNFLYHEMMSHPVLAHHPDPQTVVVIGGGDCGTLREVLRHDTVQRAVQVEIDERVTRLAEEHFPELCAANDDPRAELLFDDGVAWMRNAPAGSLDVIIVDSTDPIGPAEGLFNQAFYASCLRALGEDGLLIQQSESPLTHTELMRDMHSAMRAAGFASVHPVLFPQPIYPSGWWSGSIASQQAALPALRPDATKGFAEALRYYTPAMHEAAMTLPPFLSRALAPR